MSRLFIALDLPEDARDKLAAMSYGLPGAAWVPPEQLHLTLRFLGEVDGETFTMIREALGGVQGRKFHLSLKGVGHFPKRGDPEVLWVGITGGDEVIRLRNRIESLLVKRGVEPDARKFHPHVTLARIKDTKAPWIGRYLIDNSLFALHEIPVQAFHLYSSRLTPAGAEHTLEASYPLEGVLEAVD